MNHGKTEASGDDDFRKDGSDKMTARPEAPSDPRERRGSQMGLQQQYLAAPHERPFRPASPSSLSILSAEELDELNPRRPSGTYIDGGEAKASTGASHHSRLQRFWTKHKGVTWVSIVLEISSSVCFWLSFLPWVSRLFFRSDDLKPADMPRLRAACIHGVLWRRLLPAILFPLHRTQSLTSRRRCSHSCLAR